jgi:tetratricopeptide (TPR) repeat protein
VRREGGGAASKAFRDAVPEERQAWAPEEWIDEGPVRQEAAEAVGRGRRRRQPEPEPEPDTSRLERRLPAKRAERARDQVKAAAKAFRRERFEEARKLLKPLVDLVPDDPVVRELYGLTLYRLERWRSAVTQLEAFAEQTGTVEQHPVLADCHRALGRHARVAELWEELREAQAPAPLIAEGRIVYAGDLADQGRLSDAIRELERSRYEAKQPKEHHLRLRYALADLHERAGDVPRARELFASVAAADREYADVATRLRNLG